MPQPCGAIEEIGHGNCECAGLGSKPSRCIIVQSPNKTRRLSVAKMKEVAMRCSGRLLLVALGFLVRASLFAQPRVASKPARPLTYGTSVVSYLRVPAVEFLPLNSAVQYSTSESRYSTNLGGANFAAALHLPAGAHVVYLELDYLDSSASNYVSGGLRECDYQGNFCTSHPTNGVGDPDCVGTGYLCSGLANDVGFGYILADVSGESIFVDNNDNEYLLRAGNSMTDGLSGLTGMMVGYVLVVSPPPATADFTDVPTTHPFFQFIEALYHAGITVGCGGSNYCPDKPVTRGQMAVYLAKALGLQWQ